MVNFTKKIIAATAVLAAAFAVNTASAQDYYNNTQSTRNLEEKNFRLGLSINPNIGWLRYNDDDVYDASSKVGFSYGLVADLGFAKNYYFSTGLLINSINSNVDIKASENTEAEKKEIRLQYVDVPLTIKLKSDENTLGRYYGQFGFTAGFKVSGKEKIGDNSKKQDIDGDDIFRLGLQLGGGMEWKLSDNLNLMTGLTFNNGFTRAIKDGKPKTSFVALNVGVFF